MNYKLLATYVIFTLHTVAFFIQFMDLPFIAKRFGVSDSTYGISQAMFGLLQIIGGPVFAVIINNFGLKSSLHICNLMTILMCILLIIFNNSFGLFLSRVPGFLMQGMQAHKSLLAEITKPGEERTNAFGKVGLCFGLSFVIAPLINRLASGYSDSLSLYISILLSILAIWITQFLIHDSDVQSSDKKSDDKKEDNFTLESILNLAKKDNVLTIFLQKNISVLSGLISFSVLQLYLIDNFDLTQKENSTLQMIMGFSLMIVSAIGLPKMRKQFTESQLIIFATISFLVLCLQCTYFVNIYQLGIILPSFSFGMGVINPVAESMLSSSVSHKEQPLLLGITTSAFSACQAIAPAIGGFILQNYGFNSLGIVGVIGTVSSLFISYLIPVKSAKMKSK